MPLFPASFSNISRLYHLPVSPIIQEALVVNLTKANHLIPLTLRAASSEHNLHCFSQFSLILLNLRLRFAIFALVVILYNLPSLLTLLVTIYHCAFPFFTSPKLFIQYRFHSCLSAYASCYKAYTTKYIIVSHL